MREIATDFNKERRDKVVIFSIPSSQINSQKQTKTSSKFIELFKDEEFREDSNSNWSSISSFKKDIYLPSPDFIIATIESSKITSDLQAILKKQTQEIDSLDIYSCLKGKLKVEDIKAVVSLKTSYRGDRRYQPLFEAAVIKAMSYISQQTWKYYVVASRVSPADETLFSKAISPHGIVLGNKNLKLVDQTYTYNCKQDLVPLVKNSLE